MRNPWKKLLMSLRHSGKDLRDEKIPIVITWEDLRDQFERQQRRCYWLGIKLNPDDAYRTRYCLSPSIDRLNNSDHYRVGNFVICARFANLGRGPLTVEQFAPQMKAIRKMIYGDMWPVFPFETLTTSAENPNIEPQQKDLWQKNRSVTTATA